MITEAQVLTILKDVYDPEMPINVVDMGLIYGVEISEEKVHIRMTLTSPGCPMAGSIMDEVKQAVLKGTGAKACDVELVFEPRWTPELIKNEPDGDVEN